MKRILKNLGISLLFLMIFLIVTFPINRFGPKIRTALEKGLQQMDLQATCNIEDMGWSLPLGVQWSKIACTQADAIVFELLNGKVTALPSYQSVTAQSGKGQIELKANAGIRSAPSEVDLTIDNISMDRILTLVLGAIRFSNPRILLPRVIKAEGLMKLKSQIPLTALHKKSGFIDLQIQGLRLPQQATLESFGLKDMEFSKAIVKAELKNGKLGISEFSFVSNQFSFKVEGGLDFQEDLPRSVGPLTVKWKVEKTDSIMSSPFGRIWAENCPNRDSENFCSKRYARLSELLSGS